MRKERKEVVPRQYNMEEYIKGRKKERKTRGTGLTRNYLLSIDRIEETEFEV